MPHILQLVKFFHFKQRQVNAESHQPRIYRISIWRYLVMWWALGPFLLLGLGLALFSDESRGAGVAIALLMAPFLLLWHWLVGKARLEVSATGVRLHDFGGGCAAAWGDIVDLRVDRGHEGFITGAPLEGKGALHLAQTAGPMQMHDERDLELIGARRFIPLKAFAFHLRRGDLRADIGRHAPHLLPALAALDAPPAPKPPLSPAARRRNGLLALVGIAAIAGSFVLIAQGARWQTRFFTAAYAIIDPLFALTSGYYAWQLLKRKNWLLGVPILLFALVMVGWTARNWTQLLALLRGAQ